MDCRLTLNTFTATNEAAVCDQSCAFLCHLNFCQQFLDNLSTIRCNIDYKPIALYYIGTDWRRIPNHIHHSITLVVVLTIWIVPLVMCLHVNSCVKWIVCYVSDWMTSWRAHPRRQVVVYYCCFFLILQNCEEERFGYSRRENYNLLHSTLVKFPGRFEIQTHSSHSNFDLVLEFRAKFNLLPRKHACPARTLPTNSTRRHISTSGLA